ncbi:MAG: type II toxin-antitoxin system VapC family toxin [Actinobacteria bacterium]|nr:type II toxin-antitoxin system VapC family toxin [Actinomycetota bacterium]
MSYVIDASAVIALLRDEPGAARVFDLLNEVEAPSSSAAYISTVNLAEIHQQLGTELPEGLIGGEGGVIRAADFTAEHAREAAVLYEATRAAGLSLADRACLALAKVLGLPAVTADRQWARVDAGVEVELIR